MHGYVVRAIVGTMASSDFSHGIDSDFAIRLIPSLTRLCDPRPYEISLVAHFTVTTFRSLLRRGILQDCISRYFVSSMAFAPL